MLIVCPTCAMSYEIGLAALGEAGRSVRCAQCKNTWFAAPQSVVAETEAPAAPAVMPPARRADDFPEGLASDFSVQTMMPSGENAAPEETGTEIAIIDAPPLAPHEQPDDAAPSVSKFEPGEPDGVETIAARRARHTYADRRIRRTTLQRILSIPVFITVMLAILLGALQWRVALVRQFPQTASLFSLIGMPVNLRGLTFQDVKSHGEFVDGAMVLVVEGTIVNLTPRALEVPRLRLGLRNGVGHEVYAWTALPTRSTLGSGDGLAFRTRLASPPPDGRDVIVRFFSRRDAGFGS